MKNRNRLFSHKDPYDVPGSDGLFLKAMRENCSHHYAENEKYRKILEAVRFTPDMIETFNDLADLPFIPTAVFKKYDLNTMSSRGTVTATSSGTGGRKSILHFDMGTLFQALKMALKVTGRRKLISLKPANYIVFGYEPHKDNKTAVARNAYLTTLLAPALKRVYALKYENGQYIPDLEHVISAIQEYSHSHFPARFIGFPSYTYFAMQMMDERGINVRLPKGSIIMLGGGWKQFYKEQADKQSFYRLAEKVLGVGEDHIIEFFGAAEHPVLYCDCPEHRFHVPVYGRVIIRDVNTLRPVPEGTAGLVNLLTPLSAAAPILSIMTDDLGVLRSGEDCPCGLKSPTLEIIGRVGLKDIKTCAAGAEETLKGGGEQE